MKTWNIKGRKPIPTTPTTNQPQPQTQTTPRSLEELLVAAEEIIQNPTTSIYTPLPPQSALLLLELMVAMVKQQTPSPSPIQERLAHIDPSLPLTDERGLETNITSPQNPSLDTPVPYPTPHHTLAFIPQHLEPQRRYT